jgi:hypothetical protein
MLLFVNTRQQISASHICIITYDVADRQHGAHPGVPERVQRIGK